MTHDLISSSRRTGSLGSGLPRRQPIPGDQLDLFAIPSDWVCEEERNELAGLTSAAAYLAGRYAGHLFLDDKTGKWRGWVSLGWIIYSMTADSNHNRYVGEFATFAEAEHALERVAREARSDPKLIWDNGLSKENIRKAKANGWWRHKA